jgi:hypothetical protein
MLVAAVAAFVPAALGAGVRSTFGGEAAVDEPQYLLTALSFWEDAGDDPLDISDELAAERWRDFHDAELPVQTEVQPDGRQVSPHDPLLPLMLAIPMGLGGYLAAKIALAGLAAAVAALAVWVAVRRFAVRPLVAGGVIAGLAAAPPLAVYGQQVYPELPAAGAVLVAVAAGTGRLGRSGLVTVGLAVTALPWLSVKYAPVAAVLALVVLVTLVRRQRLAAAGWLAGGLAIAGLAYLVAHHAWYGGFTVYASGDHFVETGEFTVVGVDPDYAGRTLRLAGLLVDRTYGLGAWAPLWLLAPMAMAATARRRFGSGGALLVLPVAAGWFVATWMALTMHGFWWPGRQTVVVLPLVAVAVAWSLDHVLGAPGRAASAALAAVGLVSTGWLLADGWNGELTWVSRFEDVDNPLFRLWRRALPDYHALDAVGWALHVTWVLVLLGSLLLGWRAAGRHDVRHSRPGVSPSTGGPQAPAPDHRKPSSTLTSA